MSTPVVVIGAGGFGRETLDVIDAMNEVADKPIFDVLGVLDSGPSTENLARLADRGISYLGTEAAWLESGNRASFLIGIGSPIARERVDRAFTQCGLTAAVAVHPRATLGSKVVVGDGAIVCAGVHVSTNVVLGRQVHLNPNVTIGHDTVLEDFVSVNPSAVVSGNVCVGAGSLIGAGAVVLQNLMLGYNVTIGASACVTHDVENSAVRKGVPAR